MRASVEPVQSYADWTGGAFVGMTSAANASSAVANVMPITAPATNFFTVTPPGTPTIFNGHCDNDILQSDLRTSHS